MSTNKSAEARWYHWHWPGLTESEIAKAVGCQAATVRHALLAQGDVTPPERLLPGMTADSSLAVVRNAIGACGSLRVSLDLSRQIRELAAKHNTTPEHVLDEAIRHAIEVAG